MKKTPSDISHLESLERTFVMIKPDGVKRGMVGRIFTRLENLGLKLVASRMIQPTDEQARGNYPGTEDWLTRMGKKTHANYDNDMAKIEKDLGTTDALEIGNMIYDGLVTYLTSGPVVLMVWEGNHATAVIRKIAGVMSPDIAAPGTIRGDVGFDSPKLAVKSGRVVVQNLIHISDSQEEADREIKHWFGEKYKYLGKYDRIDYMGSYEAF
ncbi:MAG: nucleoside-diphosphate kinase [Candidatus Dojkabacteria bacterium]|nr:nucleoside-diphosphate kinase [Candidatus Dojkabacteria bacterium]MDQ7021756.1 nucleoside-diphosphate kinase [Candidatus Dojkabacteria bacterium]